MHLQFGLLWPLRSLPNGFLIRFAWKYRATGEHTSSKRSIHRGHVATGHGRGWGDRLSFEVEREGRGRSASEGYSGTAVVVVLIDIVARRWGRVHHVRVRVERSTERWLSGEDALARSNWQQLLEISFLSIRMR